MFISFQVLLEWINHQLPVALCKLLLTFAFTLHPAVSLSSAKLRFPDLIFTWDLILQCDSINLSKVH